MHMIRAGRETFKRLEGTPLCMYSLSVLYDAGLHPRNNPLNITQPLNTLQPYLSLLVNRSGSEERLN